MKGVLRKTRVVAVLVVAALGLAGCGTSKPARKNVLTPQPSATGDSVALFRSLHVDQDMVKAGKAGRWAKRPMRPTYITIHSTENYSRAADAHQHAKALKNGALRGRKSPTERARVAAACRAAIHISGSTRPDPAQVEVYRQAYPLYRELYPLLKPVFARMA